MKDIDRKITFLKKKENSLHIYGDTQEIRFLRHLVAKGSIDVFDGFIIFEEWVFPEKKSKDYYKNRLSKLSTRAQKTLLKEGFKEGTGIGQFKIRGSKNHSQQLSLVSFPASDVGDVKDLFGLAEEHFLCGNDFDAWHYLEKAGRIAGDQIHIESLVYTLRYASHIDIKIMNRFKWHALLQKYKVNIQLAMCKLISLPKDYLKQFPPFLIRVKFANWVNTIIQINEVLDFDNEFEFLVSESDHEIIALINYFENELDIEEFDKHPVFIKYAKEILALQNAHKEMMYNSGAHKYIFYGEQDYDGIVNTLYTAIIEFKKRCKVRYNEIFNIKDVFTRFIITSLRNEVFQSKYLSPENSETMIDYQELTEALHSVTDIKELLEYDYEYLDFLRLPTTQVETAVRNEKQEFILKNKISFDAFIEGRTRYFVGREWLLNIIKDRIKSTGWDSGYILLQGKPGVGKSAVLSKFIQDEEIDIFHINIPNSSDNTTENFLKNICARILEQYNIDYDSFEEDFYKKDRILSKLLDKVSPHVSKEQPLVIVIDGLNEVVQERQDAPYHNVLDLPETLPDNIYFVVSAIDFRKIPLSADHIAAPITINDYTDKHTEDIIKHIEGYYSRSEILQEWLVKSQINKETFISKMLLSCEANFMYLHHVLPAITGNVLGNIWKTLPIGLESYYRIHWFRMQEIYKCDFNEKIKLVICMIGAANSYVALDKVCHWTGLPRYKIHKILEEWKEFIAWDGSTKSEVRLYHSSFAEYLRKEIDPGLKYYHGLIARAILKLLNNSNNDYCALDTNDRDSFIRHLLNSGEKDLILVAQKTLLDFNFLTQRVNSNQIFSIIQEIDQVATLIDNDNNYILKILNIVLKNNSIFLSKYPTELFSCLWNDCWWYDSPHSVQYYNLCYQAVSQEKHRTMVSSWLEQNQKHCHNNKQIWLKSIRPKYAPYTKPRNNVFAEHETWISALAFSENERFVASCDYNGVIYVRDITSTEVIQKLTGKCEWIKACAFIEDDSKLITITEKTTLSLWEIKSGNKLFEWEIHSKNTMSNIYISTEKQTIFFVSTDYFTTYNYNTDSIKEYKKWNISPSLGMSVSRNGEKMAASLNTKNSHSFYAIDIDLNKESLIEDWITLLSCISQNGQYIAYASAIYDVDICDTISNNKVSVRSPGYGHKISVMAFSSDNKYLACAGNQYYKINLYEVKTGKLINSFAGHTHYATSLVLNHSKLLSGGMDGTVRIWDLNEKYEKLDSEIITSITEISPDNTYVAAIDEEGYFEYWNIETGIGKSKVFDFAVSNFVFTPDSKRVLVGGDYGEIILYDFSERKIIANYTDRKLSIVDLDISSCGNFAVYSGKILKGSNYSIVLMNLCTGDIIDSFNYIGCDVYSIYFSPNNAFILIKLKKAHSNCIDIWNIKDRELQRVITEKQYAIFNIKISNDSMYFAGSYNNGLCIIVDTKKHSTKIVGKESEIVKEILFLEAQNCILIHYESNLIQKWDFFNGTLLEQYNDGNISSYLSENNTFPFKFISNNTETLMVTKNDQFIAAIPERLFNIRVILDKNIIVGDTYNRISIHRIMNYAPTNH